MITLDMRKKACPQPVIETKRALDANTDTICTIVDNITAVENITKMAKDLNCQIEVTKSNDTLFYVYTSNTGDLKITEINFKNVLVLNSEFMGENQELGASLMQACIHTLCDIDNIPKTIVLYNSAVKLFENNENIYNDFENLEKMGVEIISCGACINFYNITKNVGRITNMYEILQILSSDEKIIYV
ncbi:MAG: sulfurtransferase-like selenium metabolism protein YedF [Bacilli bacterium]